MKLHEKSLELNITHELLNLADSWYWFLTDIPLFRYWRPRYRLPFLKHPKSTAAGFHITSEGKPDPTGEAGGGFDVRIKSGIGKHLLFLQYKLGHFVNISPHPGSRFSKAPHEHYRFQINSTSNNQHFLLLDLAKGVGSKKGNAVVYAFPLIKDIDEMEKYGGKLIRRTKFVSVKDIDDQAKAAKKPFKRGVEHNFRIGAFDMSECEINYYYYYYYGPDRTKEVIADMIGVKFQSILSFFINEIRIGNYEFDNRYLAKGLQRAFGPYLRYMLHYFEVNPEKLSYQGKQLLGKFTYINDFYDYGKEFESYESSKRDIEIISSVYKVLDTFTEFMLSPTFFNDKDEVIIKSELPTYDPTFFILIGEQGLSLTVGEEYKIEDLENISFLTM